MSAQVQRLFWGWDAPVLEKAVVFLCDRWDQNRALDLSDTLILVPNGEAGRRLREALAQETHQAGTAAIIPHLWLPEQALLPQSRRFEAATPLQSQMAWQRALERTDLTALKDLFPTLPAERGWGWHAETARMLADLKMLLGTGGLTFAATTALPAIQRDAARWRDLAVIERAYFDELARAGIADAQALKARNARAPVLPDGVKRIAVLASPDLPPLLDDWIASCAEHSLEVVIAVHAPQSLQHTFDRHGRPLPAHWGEEADNSLAIQNEQIHIIRDPAMQAARALDLMRELVPQGKTALGVCDAEVGSLLLEKLTLENARSFEPGGIPVQREGLWHVLDCFRVLLGSGSWRAFAALLRVTEFRDALVPAAVKVGQLLKDADDFSTDHLPVTLDHAQELPLDSFEALQAVVQATLELLDTLRRLPPSKAARTLILKLLGERDFNPEAPGHRERTELAAEWLRIAEELENESKRFGLKPKAEDVFSLSLDCLAQSRLAEPRGDIDLVLQGWLELLWEKAPNLVVSGLNEEHVPGIFISHPFLPDALRQELQLPCQQTRFSRDAFILAALAHQREAKGNLELLCGQWSEDGDALRPSRLLFLCDDASLPQRVAHLFPKEDAQRVESEPPRSLAWPLKPDWTAKPLETISPSRLREYLTCPFRYYLTFAKNMRAVETQKRELDAAEFGQIIHAAFHHLFQDKQMRDSTHPGKIADFLEEAARNHVSHQFGQRPAPLITLQVESIVQRLRQAAQIEATNRQEGWECIDAELKIGQADDPTPLRIADVRLNGRIDRVEQHADGTIRIVDFKSSDKTKKPHESHFKAIGPRSKLDEADDWKCFDLCDGRRAMWLDLQLPLYAAAMRQRGFNVTRAAYFVLPKSIQETAILEWENFDDTIITAALSCADEAVKRIQSGQFWPPAERSPNDSFDEILLHDPLHSVQPLLA
jgi:ATP-dependent helicase/nuclease subunit B